MEDRSFYWGVTGIIGVILLAAVFLYSTEKRNLGGATSSGIEATVATTTDYLLGTTQGVLFATSSCAVRVISTTGESSIMLTFTDKQGKVPSGFFGHIQAASSTVAYDGGVYGCGTIRGYSFVEQILTLTESR